MGQAWVILHFCVLTLLMLGSGLEIMCIAWDSASVDLTCQIALGTCDNIVQVLVLGANSQLHSVFAGQLDSTVPKLIAFGDPGSIYVFGLYDGNVSLIIFAFFVLVVIALGSYIPIARNGKLDVWMKSWQNMSVDVSCIFDGTRSRVDNLENDVEALAGLMKQIFEIIETRSQPDLGCNIGRTQSESERRVSQQTAARVYREEQGVPSVIYL
ncbi:hypothetical protein EDD17DRAFT_1511800 [Pisolithus thermaeus]|nr:hypothetical protein EDD17DRAFT_1511800 [Pisolithus thermaeus]